MVKATLFLSCLCLVLLVLGSLLAPTYPAMWLADTSTTYIWLRVGLIFVLLVLFVTTPPRTWLLRIALGLAAIGTLSGTIVLTYAENMKFLDSLSLSAASVAIGAAALEINYDSASVDVEFLRHAKDYSAHVG